MTTTTGSSYALISSDTHAGADLLDYKPYLGREWHEAFDAWASDFYDPWAVFGSEETSGAAGSAAPDLHTDTKLGIASFLDPLNWDSAKRLAELEQNGITAEVIFPNTVPPFHPSGVITAPGPRSAEEYRQRKAGLQAHNRWLADFCDEVPGRRAGLAQVVLFDLDDAIAEVRWAREHGLKGVLLPSDHLLQMNSLYSPHLDRLWAVCEALGMPVHRHGIVAAEAGRLDVDDPAPAVGAYEAWFYIQRPLAHLLLAGVFERYPGLKFVITEGQAAWVVKVLEQLDSFCDGARRPGTIPNILAKRPLERLKQKPSEAFATNCYLGTFFTPPDIEHRHEIGVDRLMWGSDYPHLEGTFPYTREALRANFADVPEAEVRQMTSVTAATVYGFDLAALQPIADRIGPTPDEVRTPLRDDEWPQPGSSMCPSLVESYVGMKQDAAAAGVRS